MNFYKKNVCTQYSVDEAVDEATLSRTAVNVKHKKVNNSAKFKILNLVELSLL